MNQKLKELKKNIDKEMKQKEYKKDEEGRIIVNMNVKDDDDFLSVFSASKNPSLIKMLRNLLNIALNPFIQMNY